MKRIVKSRLDDHILDLYNRVDDVKKDLSVIKNNHLKHMGTSIYKIEQRLEKMYWSMLAGLGSLALTLIVLAFK